MELKDIFQKIGLLDVIIHGGEVNLGVLPTQFSPLCNLLFQHYQKFPVVEYRNTDIEKQSISGDDTEVIVCFSGGLKSIATVFFYLNKGYGFDVKLYYIRQSPYQTKIVRQLAHKFNLDLYEDRIAEVYSGPLSHISIINSCIRYCQHEGLDCDVAIGDFSNVSINDNSFQEYGAYCNETWEAYEVLMKAVDEHFRVRRPIPMSSYMLDLLKPHPSYIKMAYTGKAEKRKVLEALHIE